MSAKRYTQSALGGEKMAQPVINYASETCAYCGGSGKVSGGYRCPACGGTGWAHALRHEE